MGIMVYSLLIMGHVEFLSSTVDPIVLPQESVLQRRFLELNGPGIVVVLNRVVVEMKDPFAASGFEETGFQGSVVEYRLLRLGFRVYVGLEVWSIGTKVSGVRSKSMGPRLNDRVNASGPLQWILSRPEFEGS